MPEHKNSETHIVLFATPTEELQRNPSHHEAVMMNRDYIPGNTKKKYDQNLGR
jgi:hypothetical protein